MDAALSLVCQVEQFLKTHAIAPLRVVVAVSGGPDSVALLCALASLSAGSPDPNDVMVIAHFNHQLRGSESDGDEAFVRQLHTVLCNTGSGKILLRCERADTRGQADVEKDNLESIARRLRYDWLVRVARELEISYVATGHTADDQAETVLHRLLRGTGLKGLAGIAPRRPLLPGVEVIRPLLHIRREAVLAYLEQEGQPYRVDRTNADMSYTRNRIRHQLLPHLVEQYNPAVVSVLGRLAEQAAQTASEWETLAQTFLQETELPKAGERLVFDRRRLAGLPRHLVREIFRAAWAREGWPLRAMGYSEWDRLAAIAHDEAVAVDLPGGIRAQTRDHVVLLGPVS